VPFPASPPDDEHQCALRVLSSLPLNEIFRLSTLPLKSETLNISNCPVFSSASHLDAAFAAPCMCAAAGVVADDGARGGVVSGCCATPTAVRAPDASRRRERPYPHGVRGEGGAGDAWLRSCGDGGFHSLVVEERLCSCSSPALPRSHAAFRISGGPEISESKSEFRDLYVKYGYVFLYKDP
jgi:hypothetical protein